MADTQGSVTSPELGQPVEALVAMIRGGMPPNTAYDRLRLCFGDGPARVALVSYRQRTGMICTPMDPSSFDAMNPLGGYAGPGAHDHFWPALKRYLLEEERRPVEAVEAIDRATTKTLALVQHAELERVRGRCLVVGPVPRAEWASDSALLAKAADVGYRLFIVLAGPDDRLRRRAERRLRRELTERHDTLWLNLTSREEGFRPPAGGNTNALLAEGSHLRILCVVNEHATVLRRLLEWLRAGSPQVLGRCPALIIDDVPDRADLRASRDPGSRTAVERLLLEILELLPKAAYVGTAAEIVSLGKARDVPDVATVSVANNSTKR